MENTEHSIIQTAHLPVTRIMMPKDYLAFDVTVDGGLGGNSDADIDKNRANAIKILANFLLVAIRQLDIKMYLVNFIGGQDATTIPGDAEAKIIIPKDDMETFATLLDQCQGAIREQFSDSDPEVEITAQPTIWRASVFSEESTHVFLASINAIPAGMVHSTGSVGLQSDTFNNIGVVRTVKDTVNVINYTRSFSGRIMKDLSDNISKIFTLTGATIEVNS